MMGLNGGAYTWRITDRQMMNSMSNAENQQSFESEIFEIANLKWQLLLYPNGHGPKWKGYLCVRLKPIDIHQVIAKIVFFRRISILETGTNASHISHLNFVEEDETVGANRLLNLPQVTKLKQISIQLQLLIYGITMKQQNVWMMGHGCTNSVAGSFPLKQTLICSAPKPSKNYFTSLYNKHESNIQGGNGFWWVLGSNPSGRGKATKGYYVVYLKLCYCSLDLSEVQVIYSIQCLENNLKKEGINTFGIDSPTIVWKFMTCEEANQLNSITFTADIEISGATAKENNPYEISDASYIANMLSQLKHEETRKNVNLLTLKQEQKGDDNEIQLLPVQFNSLTTVIDQLNRKNNELSRKLQHLEENKNRNDDCIDSLSIKNNELQQQVNNLSKKLQNLEEETKNNDSNDIMKQLLLLKQEIKQLKTSKENKSEEKEESEELKVKKWLNDVVKLPQYFDILIDSGFDDMDSIADITMGDLKELNIEKLGHKKKLIKAAKNINNRNQPMPQQQQQPKQQVINNANVPYYNPYLQNINNNNYSNISASMWICHNCNWNNVVSTEICVRCGVQKLIGRKKVDIEGVNVEDTAK